MMCSLELMLPDIYVRVTFPHSDCVLMTIKGETAKTLLS